MRAIALAVLLVATEAHADSFSLGALVGAPGEGSGPPIGGTRIPVGIVGRYELGPHSALSAGLGVPIASVGASLWAGFELRVRPFARVPRLALYAAPGLRTGFVGPGYYARHSHVFVGFEYIYSGPWTIAPRLPVGVMASLGRCDVFVEVLAEAPLLPGPELLFGAALGARIAF
jgi:hypothetical protein